LPKGVDHVSVWSATLNGAWGRAPSGVQGQSPLKLDAFCSKFSYKKVAESFKDLNEHLPHV